MTVTTDIQTPHGTHKVLYIAIDGVEPYLFQYSHYGTPTWSRSVKVCLEPPEERSMGLDLGKMKSTLSAMTFRLSDSKETDLSSYFGKLFSTGRWNNNPHLRVNAGTNYGQFLNAQATTIPIRSNVGFASTAGNGYIGQEAINWGGVNAGYIQAVGRGLFSSVNVSNPWARTYEMPPESGNSLSQPVSTVPFSFAGRRVALYVTTWDHAAEAYRSEAESELLWTGRVDDEISQVGRSGVWSLSCKSIMQELEKKVPAEFPESTLRDINCSGPKGLSFTVYFHDNNGALRVYKIISVTPGFYTPEKLMSHIASKLYYDAWVDISKPSEYPTMSMITVSVGQSFSRNGTSGEGKLSMWGQTGFNEGPGQFVIDPSFNGETCHPLGALGFSSRSKFYIAATTANSHNRYRGEVAGDEKFFHDYHPIHQDHNGGKLKVDTNDILDFWEDQGDDPGQTQAAVTIEDATLAPYWNSAVSEGNYFARYTTRTKATGVLTLAQDPIAQASRDGYAGNVYGKKFTKVTQAYIPRYLQASKNKKGPFELLLTPLLSTGTKLYNGPYDRASLDLSMGIQQDLVDIPSFLAADKAIMGNYLAHRRMYAITEPASYLDLIAKEGQLFGYALVWRSGKLTVRPVLQPDTETWTVHLTDSTLTSVSEFPDVTYSTKTVVNQYLLDIVYSPTEGEYGGKITVTDADSVTGTATTKQIKIKHNGIYLKDSKVSDIKEVLKTLLLGRFIRFPMPVMDRSMSPTLMNRVFIGDLVKVSSSRIQDPFGSGTRVTAAFAIVLDMAWNHKKNRGTTKLMMLDWPAAAAWAPSALVNIAYPNGGFDENSNSFILAPHTWTESARHHDGNAVGELAGWNVIAIERAPVDPTAPTIHGPFKASAYISSNGALPINSVPTGWNNGVEHVVTFADFADINSAQYTEDKGTWQADKASELLNQTNRAQRYR
jgi:hypothetical protein